MWLTAANVGGDCRWQLYGEWPGVPYQYRWSTCLHRSTPPTTASCWVCVSRQHHVSQASLCLHLPFWVDHTATPVFFNLFSKVERFPAILIANGTHVYGGNPEAQRAKIRRRRLRTGEGFLVREQRAPSPPAIGSGGALASGFQETWLQIQFGPTKGLENASSGRKYLMQLNFFHWALAVPPNPWIPPLGSAEPQLKKTG